MDLGGSPVLISVFKFQVNLPTTYVLMCETTTLATIVGKFKRKVILYYFTKEKEEAGVEFLWY